MEYRVLAASECEAAIALELAGYPADEAASLDSLQYRQKNVERLLLIAHEELLPLYVKAGFTSRGVSEVQHGSRPWFDCHYEL
eukprot:gene4220-3411_t